MNNREELSHLKLVIPLIFPLLCCLELTCLLMRYLLAKQSTPITIFIAQNSIINNMLFPEQILLLHLLFLTCTEEDERRQQRLLVVSVGHVFLDSFSLCGPHRPAFTNSLLAQGRGSDLNKKRGSTWQQSYSRDLPRNIQSLRHVYKSQQHEIS